MAIRLPREYRRLIKIASRRYGVAPHVLAGLIEQESSGNPNAVSSAGAFGLTQFLPSTASRYGVRRGSSHGAVSSQILGAAKYLRDLGYRSDRRAALGHYYGSTSSPYADQVLSKARAYYKRGLFGEGGGAAGGGGGGGGLRVSGDPISLGVNAPAGVGLAALLAGNTATGKPAPPISIPTPPQNFTTGPTLPKGYAAPPTAAPAVADQGGLSELLKQIQTNPTAADVTGGGVSVSGGGGGSGGGGALGHTKVRVAPGADRAGVPTSHYLQRVLSGVRGIPGGITITTGSNHNRMTVNGNVSDHWTGHAADISVPVDSGRGDLIAGRVLMRLGVPRARARQMARHGGLFNVNYRGHRWQVIWKTYEGGNHHNHVHVGVR